MQQYRVNFPLLIGLVLGGLVCSGAVFGLWKFQIERNSAWLISEAKKSRDAGEFRDAVQFYAQYLAIHPEDQQARGEFAKAEEDLAEQDDVTVSELREALTRLEVILRNSEFAGLPEAKAIRRRLIDIYGKVGNAGAALDHLNLLLESDRQDPELQVLRATNLARSGDVNETVRYTNQLIGFDPKTGNFNPKTATAPQDPKVYAMLAAIVRGKQNKPELADRILDQMIVANPKMAEAYIQRGQLRSAWGNADGARSDAEQAYRLKPEDVDALLFMTDISSKDKAFDKAAEFVAKAQKLHPKETRVYRAAADLEMKQQPGKSADERAKAYERAMAQIDLGMKQVSGTKGVELLLTKATLQLSANDLKGMDQTIEEIEKLNKVRPEIIDYLKARKMFAEGNWFQASEALNKLRSQMSDFGREQTMEIDYSLGLCYEKLVRFDLAQEKYESVLAQDPQNEPAKAGIQRMQAMRGLSPSERTSDPLQEMIMAELKKPKNEQDWTKIDGMIKELATKRQLDETTTKLFQAQMMAMREDYDGAAKLLGEAKKLSPKNLQVHRAIIQLARMDPKIGSERAMALLKNVTAQFGDLPPLRLDKADLLIQMNKDRADKELLKQQLAEVVTGIDSWTVPQKVELWNGMAGRYASLNMLDEARQNLTLAADNQPNELPLRLALFALAQDMGDDDAMKEAQAKILQVVGDRNDSAWLYAEARRKLALLRKNQLGPEALGQIRSLANQALQQRREWFELYALLAEVELLANNPALALEHFDRAEQLGRPAPNLVAAHIRLLVASGRFVDAERLIDRIPESARQTLLGPLYAEILFRSKKTDAAIAQARAATEADSQNVQNHYWYGQLLARSAQAPDLTPQRRKEVMASAIQAMQKAVEIQPEFPDAWFALINYFAMQNDVTQAQKTMRDAQLALSGDNLPIFLARSYEVLHRWFDAETMYRQLYDAAPDDLSRAQQLAAFYTGPLYQRPDRREKAAPLINQILKAGAEKKVPANDGNLLWARRTAAKVLATTREYPKLVDAEKLLTSNSQDGNLLIEDKLSLAEILAARPEPESRLKAIGLLQEVDKVQKLNDRALVQLGELYYAVGKSWSEYRRQMDRTVGLFPNSIEARQSYAEKLLLRGDQRSIEDATTHINKLRELAPTSPATFQLTVRLAGKLGKQQQVRADLIQKMPKIQDIKDLDENQARSLTMFPNLLVDLGDLDSAERIYTQLADRVPAMQFELAKFLGERRDAEKCFAKLNELYTRENVGSVLEVALGVARARRDKVGDKFDVDIQHWLDAGFRENPDSINLLIAQADLFDLQKKYQDAANTYRKLIGRNELTGIRRAVVLNNSAFLLAIDPSAKVGSDDPLKMIQEAEQIMGPNSDILDTRAVVRISLGDYKSAIADLELSVTDNPTASKYYHKARAHLLANENKAAVEAWEKAEALGLSRDSLNRMEFEQYDDMKSKIDQLRKRSVTQAETQRKAG